MEKHYRFLIIPLLLFLCFFLIVGYNNRFASDDFEFLIKLRENGWAGSVQWFHEHWNTRWAAIGLLNGVLLFTLQSGSLIWYHIISILLLWFAFFRVVANFNDNKKFSNGILAGYCAVAFFFACFSISDVFFWINTSAMYLFGSIALLIAIGEITVKKHTVGSYFRLACCGLFLAGAYEPLVFTCMVVCVVMISKLVYRHRWRVWVFPFDQKIIIFLSSLMLGFAFSYAGEGHVVRSSFLPQTDMVFKSWVLVKAVVKMFGLHLPVKILPVMLFSFPWFIYGMVQPLSWLTAGFLKKATVAFLLLVVISLVPVTFIMSEMGPERAWTQISVYLVMYSVILAMHGGRTLKQSYSGRNVLRIFMVITVCYVLATCIPNVIVANNYSDAYDSRMKRLENLKVTGQTEKVILEPLTSSGWLHSAELSISPVDFRNAFLMNYMELPFDVMVDPDAVNGSISPGLKK